MVPDAGDPVVNENRVQEVLPVARALDPEVEGLLSGPGAGRNVLGRAGEGDPGVGQAPGHLFAFEVRMGEEIPGNHIAAMDQSHLCEGVLPDQRRSPCFSASAVDKPEQLANGGIRRALVRRLPPYRSGKKERKEKEESGEKADERKVPVINIRGDGT